MGSRHGEGTEAPHPEGAETRRRGQALPCSWAGLTSATGVPHRSRLPRVVPETVRGSARLSHLTRVPQPVLLVGGHQPGMAAGGGSLRDRQALGTRCAAGARVAPGDQEITVTGRRDAVASLTFYKQLHWVLSGSRESRKKRTRGPEGCFRRRVGAGLSEVTVAPGGDHSRRRARGHRRPAAGARPLHWRDRQEDGEGWEEAEDGATVPAGPGPRGQASEESGCGFGSSLLAWEGSLRGDVPGATLHGPPVLQEVQGGLGAAGEGSGEGAWRSRPLLRGPRRRASCRALSCIDSPGNRPQLFLRTAGIFVHPPEQLRL